MTTYPDTRMRGLITLSVMGATFMQALDTTIANVALPHVQGSVSASSEELSWVLTSYIVAAAIFTPLSGWLAGRFGRKRVIQTSIMGFTAASLLCGMATNLHELVVFRLLQGMFGAALAPMSQAVLLDINPPERHGPAMAQWGMSAMLAPILGPALGGWLTDTLSWRWVFFINLPIGVLAFAGVSTFVKDGGRAHSIRFDAFGFGMLALSLACFQLVLDLGQMNDWFASDKIVILAASSAIFLYIFAVHIFRARHPFINPQLFADRNFLVSTLFGFFVNVILFSVMALLPPMLSSLMGYPVTLIGEVTAPRGVGTLISMLLVGRLVKRMDPRLLLLAGLLLTVVAQRWMSGFTLEMDQWLVVSSGFVQGIGTGLIFVPLTTMSFSTLNPALRNEGAAMYTLVRSMGSAVGVAILQTLVIRQTDFVASRLAEAIRPDNPMLALGYPDLDLAVPASGVAGFEAIILRQATMAAYANAFHTLFVVAVVAMPMLLLLRAPPRKRG